MYATAISPSSKFAVLYNLKKTNPLHIVSEKFLANTIRLSYCNSIK